MEPPNKGHFVANDFVPCGEVILILEVNNSISIGLKQPSFVENVSLSERGPFQRFHCVCDWSQIIFSKNNNRHKEIV